MFDLNYTMLSNIMKTVWALKELTREKPYKVIDSERRQMGLEHWRNCFNLCPDCGRVSPEADWNTFKQSTALWTRR